MKITGNEPVHPCILRQTGLEEFRLASDRDQREGAYLHSNFGLTIRQQFAMAAMQGILAKESWAERIHNEGGLVTLATDFAKASVKMADLLIEELNKEA